MKPTSCWSSLEDLVVERQTDGVVNVRLKA